MPRNTRRQKLCACSPAKPAHQVAPIAHECAKFLNYLLRFGFADTQACPVLEDTDFFHSVVLIVLVTLRNGQRTIVWGPADIYLAAWQREPPALPWQPELSVTCTLGFHSLPVRSLGPLGLPRCGDDAEEWLKNHDAEEWLKNHDAEEWLKNHDAEEWSKDQDRLPPGKTTACCTFSLRFVATF